MIAEQLDTTIFKSKISASVTIAEAPAHGESIITYSPKSRSAMEYMAFVKELISGVPKKTKPKKSGEDK